MSSLQAELSSFVLESERMAREAAHYKEQEQVMRGNIEILTSYLDLPIVADVNVHRPVKMIQTHPLFPPRSESER